jgi:hypothetical protein
MVTQDSTVFVELNPLCLLIEPVTNWDVEVCDFAVIECVAGGRFVEGVLIVQDTLFEVVDPILVLLRRKGGGGLSVGNGL